MAGWLGRLGAIFAPQTVPAEVLEVIEQMAYRVEPRLKQAGGYPGRYRAAAGRALEYVRDLSVLVPGPIPISRASFTGDPLVRALFATPDDIAMVLGQSAALRDWQRDHPGSGGRLFGHLTLQRREKQQFGLETRGDSVRRDVSQKVVNFTDHVFAGLADTAEGARRQLEAHFLEVLLNRLGERVDALRQDRKRLETARDEQMARLRGGKPDDGKQAGLEAALRELGAALEALDLRRLGQYIDEVLLHPEAHLRLETTRVRLDSMGIVRREGGVMPAKTLTFTDQIEGDRPGRTVLLVEYHLEDLAPYADRLSETGRWLEI